MRTLDENGWPNGAWFTPEGREVPLAAGQGHKEVARSKLKAKSADPVGEMLDSHHARVTFGNSYIGIEHNRPLTKHTIDALHPYVHATLKQGNTVHIETRNHKTGGYKLRTYTHPDHTDNALRVLSGRPEVRESIAEGRGWPDHLSAQPPTKQYNYLTVAHTHPSYAVLYSINHDNTVNTAVPKSHKDTHEKLGLVHPHTVAWGRYDTKTKHASIAVNPAHKGMLKEKHVKAVSRRFNIHTLHHFGDPMKIDPDLSAEFDGHDAVLNHYYDEAGYIPFTAPGLTEGKFYRSYDYTSPYDWRRAKSHPKQFSRVFLRNDGFAVAEDVRGWRLYKVRKDRLSETVSVMPRSGNWPKSLALRYADDFIRYDLTETAAPGFSGSTRALKNHHPEIPNPYALLWAIWRKGGKAHYKPTGKDRYTTPKQHRYYNRGRLGESVESGLTVTHASYGGKDQFVFHHPEGSEVGEISVHPRRDGHYEVSNVLVWRKHQRKGYASQMYAHAHAFAKSKGKKLYVSDDRTDDAKALHRKMTARGNLRPDGEVVFESLDESLDESSITPGHSYFIHPSGHVDRLETGQSHSDYANRHGTQIRHLMASGHVRTIADHHELSFHIDAPKVTHKATAAMHGAVHGYLRNGKHVWVETPEETHHLSADDPHAMRKWGVIRRKLTPG